MPLPFRRFGFAFITDRSRVFPKLDSPGPTSSRSPHSLDEEPRLDHIAAPRNRPGTGTPAGRRLKKWRCDQRRAVFGNVQTKQGDEEHIRYAEEVEERRPIVGMVYVDKYELPKPYPEKIRVTIELLE